MGRVEAFRRRGIKREAIVRMREETVGEVVSFGKVMDEWTLTISDPHPNPPRNLSPGESASFPRNFRCRLLSCRSKTPSGRRRRAARINFKRRFTQRERGTIGD